MKKIFLFFLILSTKSLFSQTVFTPELLIGKWLVGDEGMMTTISYSNFRGIKEIEFKNNGTFKIDNTIYTWEIDQGNLKIANPRIPEVSLVRKDNTFRLGTRIFRIRHTFPQDCFYVTLTSGAGGIKMCKSAQNTTQFTNKKIIIERY